MYVHENKRFQTDMYCNEGDITEFRVFLRDLIYSLYHIPNMYNRIDLGVGIGNNL